MNLNQTQFSVRNYLVPSSGQTHCVEFSGVLSAQAALIDWAQFSVDSFPFIPQGVFIDNTQGTGALTITVLPLNYNIVCPAGQVLQAQFPAPINQTMQVTGNGQAQLFFVDFPVLPSGQQVSIAGVANVNIESGNNQASPVYVMPPNAPGGLPYQMQKTVLPVTCEYLSTTGAAASVAPGNSNLRKLVLTVSGDASLAAAGRDLITVALNGVNIFKVSPFIPGAAGTGAVLAQYAVEFNDAAPAAGAGNLTVSAATVLATGLIELNAYFD